MPRLQASCFDIVNRMNALAVKNTEFADIFEEERLSDTDPRREWWMTWEGCCATNCIPLVQMWEDHHQANSPCWPGESPSDYEKIRNDINEERSPKIGNFFDRFKQGGPITGGPRFFPSNIGNQRVEISTLEMDEWGCSRLKDYGVYLYTTGRYEFDGTPRREWDIYEFTMRDLCRARNDGVCAVLAGGGGGPGWLRNLPETCEHLAETKQRSCCAECAHKDASALIMEDDGRITGYGAIFNEPDDEGDIIKPGAFAESLTRRWPKMLYQHIAEEPIGRWDIVREDSVGLYVDGRIDSNAIYGRHAISLIHGGGLDGMSIGYRTLKKRSEGRGRIMTKAELWEVSIVTFPMQPLAKIAWPNDARLLRSTTVPSDKDTETGLLADMFTQASEILIG